MINLPARLRARLEWLGTAIVFAITLWYWLRYFNRSTNLLDEGSTAAQAMRILNGDLIYRDFFTVVTPGSYYTVAALFAVFGETLMVLRWAVLLTGVAVAMVALLVARTHMSWPLAAGAALMTTVWGWFLGTPNYYSLQAALCSLIALGCYIHGRPDRRWMLAAGIATGVTAMVKQNVGVYVFAGLLIAIWAGRLFALESTWRDQWRATKQFIGGVAMPVVLTVAWLLIAGAGPYLYESWVYYPLVRYSERFALPFPDFLPFAENDPFDVWTKLVIYMPVAVYPLALIAIVALAIRARRTGDSGAAFEAHAVTAVTSVGAIMLLQAFPRADVTHVLFGMAPTFILFAYLCDRCRRALSAITGQQAALALIATIIALAPTAILLRKGYQRTDWEYQNYIVALRTERGSGIFTGGLEAQRIDVVTNYVRAHTAEDDWVFVVPWASGFNFLTDRMNPTRTDFMLFEDPEAYPCLLARLDYRPPKYVIYGYTWDVDGKRFREYAAPVDQYIRSRYAIEFSTDGYEVWRRIDDSAPPPSGFPRACQPRRFRISDLL